MWMSAAHGEDPAGIAFHCTGGAGSRAGGEGVRAVGSVFAGGAPPQPSASDIANTAPIVFTSLTTSMREA
jgi:hypothetical protein